MSEVEWRDVPGWQGRYRVSSDGRMWAAYRGREMRLRRSWAGYVTVSLRAGRDCPVKTGVHRLVLLAFVGECPEGMEAAHENGIRHDNRLENLAWKTKHENMEDQRRHQTLACGERQGAHRLTEQDVLAIRAAAGVVSQYALARQYGVTQSAISAIHRRKNWAWLERSAA